MTGKKIHLIKLKEFREKLGYTPGTLAKMVGGINSQKINRIEDEGQTVDVDLAEKIAKALGTTVEELQGIVKTNLPANPPLCLGREDILAELRVLFDINGPVYPKLPLTGVGGIGKTTIALHFLYDGAMERRFGKHRYFVPLETADTLDKVVIAIARELDIPLGSAPERQKDVLIAELNQGGPRLIVLDNAETPLGCAGKLDVRKLFEELARITHIGLIATLRPGYSVGGEWADVKECQPLNLEQSEKLFLEHARLPTGKLTSPTTGTDERKALDELLNYFGGWPIVIEIAGRNFFGSTSIREFAEIWNEEKSRLLSEGSDHRQLNFAICVELSIKRLDPQTGQRLIRLLGLLPDGIAEGDIQNIIRGKQTKPARNVREVGGLTYEQNGRFRVLPPLRDYLAEKYPPSDEDTRRASEVYCNLANKMLEKDFTRYLQRIRENLSNVEWAVDYAIHHGNMIPGIDAYLGLSNCGIRNGLDYRVELLELACRITDGNRYADVMYIVGETSSLRSEIKLARSQFKAGRQRSQKGSVSQGKCIFGLAGLALRKSEYDNSEKYYRQAQTIFTEAEDSNGLGNCIRGLADLALLKSEDDKAEKYFREARALYAKAEGSIGLSNCIRGLADIALRKSEFAKAEQYYRQAQEISTKAEDSIGLSNCIRGLANIALRKSEFTEAEQYYRQAQAIFTKAAEPLGLANCQLELGQLAKLINCKAEARTLLESACTMYEQIQERNGLGAAHWCLAGLSNSETERLEHIQLARKAWEGLPTPWKLYPAIFPTDPDQPEQS